MADDDNTNNAPSQGNQGDDNKGDPSDKLTPEHPRFKQVIEQLHEAKSQNEDLRRELDELKDQVNKRVESGGDKNLTQDEQDALNKIDSEMKRRGYLTKAELEERESINKRASALGELTKEYNGQNGYPKFEADDVVAYAKRNGYGDNYRAAYRDMHYDAIVAVDAGRKSRGETPPGSEAPGGGERKAPKLDMTADDISKMSDEEYEKNREKILSAIRPR